MKNKFSMFLLAVSACAAGASPSVGGAGGGGGYGGLGGYGGAGGIACVGCAEAITDGTADLLCPDSEPLYFDLEGCLCQPGGACEAYCFDSLCSDGSETPDCDDCLLSFDGCGNEYDACESDF